MAFSRPTLTQIKDRVESDLKSVLSLTTILTRSFLKAIATAMAGVSHILHGHIQDFAAKQLFWDTAEDEFLIRHARRYGLEQLAATFAEIVVTVTGTDGVPVPEDTVLVRSDGFEYTVKAEVTPSGGSVSATLVASEAGADGNISDGSTLTFASPIAGINSSVTVTSTAVEGEDQETLEELRIRLGERVQQPPAGGTVFDYIAFAKTVVGVTRVWILPGHLGQGTVGVTFVEDDEDPIIPSSAKVDEVQAAVDTQKPVTSDATVFAPTASPLDISIQLKPNTTDVRTAVEAEIDDLIFREAQVRGAVDPDEVAAGTTYDGVIPLSKINEAISIAAGEEDHIIDLTENPQPPVGGIITKGTLTFSTLA